MQAANGDPRAAANATAATELRARLRGHARAAHPNLELGEGDDVLGEAAGQGALDQVGGGRGGDGQTPARSPPG